MPHKIPCKFLCLNHNRSIRSPLPPPSPKSPKPIADPTVAKLADPSVTALPELPDAIVVGEEQQHLSKIMRNKLLKRQWLEQRKAEPRAVEKERRRVNLEWLRRQWDERLTGAGEEEMAQLVVERREVRLERLARRAAEYAERAARLHAAADADDKVDLCLDFAKLTATNEIHSLVHQLMICYAVNGKCATPTHLMLTGCKGDIRRELERLPEYERWISEKEPRSYVEAFEDPFLYDHSQGVGW